MPTKMIALGTIKNQSEIARLVDLRFEQLRQLTRKVAAGKLNGLVAHGRGGIGKTWNVEEALESIEEEISLTKITGHISPLQLYNTLMENSSSKSVVLLDDADNALTEIKALNLLKAATDTKPERWVHWASTSAKVPTTEFQFKGRVIVITNHDLTATNHFKAFLDRVASVNMTLNPVETLVRISQVASLVPKKRKKEAESVVQWIEKHFGRFDNNLSIRVFEKAMGLVDSEDPEWETLAEVAILKELVR